LLGKRVVPTTTRSEKQRDEPTAKAPAAPAKNILIAAAPWEIVRRHRLNPFSRSVVPDGSTAAIPLAWFVVRAVS
jgi:hypothetical protein